MGRDFRAHRGSGRSITRHGGYLRRTTWPPGCVCDLPPSPRARYSLSHPRTVASTMTHRLACSAALLATLASTAHPQRTAAANCAAVRRQQLTDVKITEAVAVAATRDSTTPVHVAHCRVAGTIG